MINVAHLTKHINVGGIPVYILTTGRALQALGVSQIVISSGGEMESQFREAGIESFHADLKTKSELHPKLFFQLPKIIEILRDQKIDLIHAHTRVSQVLAAIIYLLTGIPYVTTAHGFFKRRLGRMIFPAWGKKVIAISTFVKKSLLYEHHVSFSKVIRVRNGIEVKRFSDGSSSDSKRQARLHWNIPQEHFVICLISRLVHEKGIGDFLQAFKILAQGHPDIRAFIVGDGPDREAFERETKLWNLSDKVIFTGSLKNVSQVLAACDVFVHPGRVQEGFGLSIAEAMASGLPIIATDLWALKWMISRFRFGAIVKPSNPGQIAGILEDWISKPEVRSEMGIKAARVANKYFDIRSTAQRIHRVYETVLSEHRNNKKSSN